MFLEGRCPEAVSKLQLRTHQALNCGRDFRSRIVFTSQTIENRLVPHWVTVSEAPADAVDSVPPEELIAHPENTLKHKLQDVVTILYFIRNSC